MDRGEGEDLAGLFEMWKRTDLTDLEIVGALDFLAITGRIERSTDATIRCEVKVKP